MLLLEFISLFACGTFFGAAVYISIVQHPASMQAGVEVAGRFFVPMYRLAAPMQITSALVGSIGGAILSLLIWDPLWAIGALLLVSVIPFTLLVLKPINDQLLDSSADRSDLETEVLLKKWAPRHWVRSVASGLSFAIYLWVSIAA